MLLIKPSNAMAKAGPEVRRLALKWAEAQGHEGKFGENLANGFTNSIWHYLDSVFRQMDVTSRPMQARLEAMPELLGIEPQVLLRTLGQTHPVHYYLRDLTPERQGGAGEPVQPSDQARQEWAENDDGSRIVQTHQRPYVVPKRKDGRVVMLVGRSEVLLDNAGVIDLVHHLVTTAAAPSDQAEPLQTCVSLAGRPDDDALPSRIMAKGVSVQITDSGKGIGFHSQSFVLWDAIASQVLRRVRQALGMPN